MDRTALEAAAILFALCLPFSLWSWVEITMGLGLLRDEASQPLWYRLLYGWVTGCTSEHMKGLIGAWGGALTLVFFNLSPALLVLLHGYGLQTTLVGAGYFAVQAALLVPLARAIARERSARR